MELKMDGYLTKKQFLLAIKLGLRALPVYPGKMTFELWKVQFVVGIVLITIGIGFFLSNNFILSLFLIILGAIFTISGINLKKKPEKSWNSIEGIHFIGSVSDEGIEFVTSNGQIFLYWDDFFGFAEGGDIVLLIQKETKTVQIIPKQFFADALSWQVFRNLVSERLPLTYSLNQNNVSFEKTNPFLYILLGIVTLVLLIYSFLSK